jgi:hypothetical protein
MSLVTSSLGHHANLARAHLSDGDPGPFYVSMYEPAAVLTTATAAVKAEL